MSASNPDSIPRITREPARKDVTDRTTAIPPITKVKQPNTNPSK